MVVLHAYTWTRKLSFKLSWRLLLRLTYLYCYVFCRPTPNNHTVLENSIFLSLQLQQTLTSYKKQPFFQNVHFPSMDNYFFMFCWPCISIYVCNETNLMHYLSSVYPIIIPLHVLGLLVAHNCNVINVTNGK
jgi:hypothetical protein